MSSAKTGFSLAFDGLRKVGTKPGLAMIGTGAIWGAYFEADITPKGMESISKDVIHGAAAGGFIGFVLALDKFCVPRWPVSSAFVAVSCFSLLRYQLFVRGKPK